MLKVKAKMPRIFDLAKTHGLYSASAVRAMVAEVEKDMGDQMRANALRDGGPGGAYPKLSGYNVSTAKEVQKRGRALLKRKGIKGVKGQKFSRHSGYARRKQDGKTPARGRHQADVRLRDTGSLYAGFVGRSRSGFVALGSANSITVEARANGQEPGRPSNDTLLYYHATGAGNLPKRNPTDKMDAFLRRCKLRVQKLVKEATANKSSRT